MWAVLPIKDVSAAKQRLQTILTPEERESLFRAMLQDVVAAVASARGLDGLAIVSSDPLGVALARRQGALLIAEDTNRGQSSAISSAVDALMAKGVKRILTIPGDVPLVTPGEIDAVCASLGKEPAMTIVPDRGDTGSNCIAISPPDAIVFRFGTHSLKAHLQSARERNLTVNIMRLTGLGLDIDSPDDLISLMDSDADTKARSFLRTSGITDRLRQAGGVAGGADHG
jgi:2-phospho-L-lactate guanylyltransferase